MAGINLSVIHNRLKRGTSKKEVSVELCFSYKGKRRYYSTGIKVTPNQWSDNTKKVIKRKDSDEMNALLEAYRSRACDIIEKLVKKGDCELDTAISMMKGEDGRAFPSSSTARSAEMSARCASIPRSAMMCLSAF